MKLGKLTCKQSHSLNTISMSGVGRDWEVKALPNQLKHVRALTVKKGNWLGCAKELDLPRPYHIPYIDSRGKFTGCTLYKSSITSQDFLATVISTVASRLRSWVYRHNDRIKYKSRKYLNDLITRSSAIYAMTKNNYMLDRLLVLFKDFERQKESVRGVLAHFASKLDANKGFIYGQACSHAHWLTSRAQRPRDKSSPILHSYPFREVGISNFAQRKVFIYEAIYATTTVVAHIGSTIYSQLV